MSKLIGSVLARTFREICEDSNTRVKADYSKVSAEEIKKFEDILKKVDKEGFDFEKELKKLFEITED